MKGRIKLRRNGDTRIRRRFAIFPVVVWKKGVGEWRWLQMVITKQVYREFWYESYWENIEFIDEEHR